MIESLYIEGFRGFRDADLSPLSTVNVIVGAGNTGKTTLLEAVFAACGIGAPVLLLRALEQRGVALRERTAREILESLKWFFPNGDFEKPCGFTVVQDGESRRTAFRRINGDMNVIEVSSSSEIDTTPDAIDDELRGAIAVFEGETWIGNRSYTGLIRCKADSVEVKGSSIESRPVGRFHRVDAHRGASYSLAPQWTKAEDVGDAERIQDLMRVLEPKAKEIRVAADDAGKALLRVVHEEYGRVPLETFGDGFAKSLSIGCNIAAASDGLLLFDEFEVSLHIGALRQVVGFTLEAARRNNVQIVATTHSLETLDAFIDLSAESTELWGGPEDLRVIHLRQKGDGIEIRNMDGREAKEVRETLALDLRRIA